jgi:hypothetical protein
LPRPSWARAVGVIIAAAVLTIIAFTALADTYPEGAIVQSTATFTVSDLTGDGVNSRKALDFFHKGSYESFAVWLDPASTGTSIDVYLLTEDAASSTDQMVLDAVTEHSGTVTYTPRLPLKFISHGGTPRDDIFISVTAHGGAAACTVTVTGVASNR